MALYFSCGKTSGPKATRDYSPAPSALHGSQRSRRHELHEVIKLAYKTEKIKLNRAPTNTAVWRIVQNPEYDIEEIINDVTNTYIEWSDWKAQPREMKRSTFNNFITSLKKGTKT